jgi:hypothetical protein
VVRDPDEAVLRNLRLRRAREVAALQREREQTDAALTALEQLAEIRDSQRLVRAVQTVRKEVHDLRRRVDAAT